jgi:hypothetical protein
MGLGELAVPLGGGAVRAGEDHQGGSRRAVGRADQPVLARVDSPEQPVD